MDHAAEADARQVPFEHDGVTYQSAEMWMMIQKARLFGDEVCSNSGF
jgi:predicted NAD-dependent protein-ADP-ribosyltransferase YbiA (DUF1768 family)